jgi:DNA polymerase (family 10)
MPDNYAIADQFSLLSKLMDIHQENSFKSKSYASAAFSIEKLPMQLEQIPRNDIPSLKGIGESSAKKIIELLDTGKLTVLEELITKTPQGILEMMQIKGLGPKKICTIWKEMGIESIGELLYACNENRLLHYKGFGEKTQKNVADAISYYLRHQGHFLYAEIIEYATHLQNTFQKEFPTNQSYIVGDIARQLPTTDKISLLTETDSALIKAFMLSNGFELLHKEQHSAVFKGQEQVNIEVVFTDRPSLIKNQFVLNGSEEFIKAWTGEFPRSLDNVMTEEEIFQRAGIHFIPPFLREEPSIIEAAKKESFNDLIQPSDIKGIIHSHSDWSDGLNTIEQMAKACILEGFQYLVISDHSKSAFYANGLSEERIKAQHQYIDELNHQLAPFKIFKSIECDILNDGSLDYSTALLGTFDLVIASIHSNLKMSEEKAMQRIITAIENPFTRILGHPTGRLLLSREGYPIDHTKVIEACIANKVVIEINAHPRRLDMDWKWISAAQNKGALFTINPDAHAIEGYKDIKYGVLASQKGGLKSGNNLSSFSLAEFERFLSDYKS